MKVSEKLIFWYLKNGRDLPWRHTKDPYYIWLSEIILQQTRVDQGLAYYLRFVNTYPTIGILAAADEQEILKLWQGLGYYSRARNLLATAVVIQNEYQGVFPQTYAEILKLKGIGPYTAAAIASFAFKLPHAVVDGNVSRVLSRIFDVPEAINEPSGKKTIEALAESCLDQKEPDTYNQAIMELGALICTPQSPKCEICPVADKCMALENATVDQRPVKTKLKKARVRHMHYAALESENAIIFRKRSGKDIWHGLHDFFAIEEIEVVDSMGMAAAIRAQFPGIQLGAIPGSPKYTYKHQLTHQQIQARFWQFEFHGEVIDNSLYLSIPKEEIEKVAVPRLIHKYLEDAGLL